jgi:hypothetical protein
MNNHDEVVFENDSLHGLEELKDKTKTQEDTGNQGGYQGPNRKERDQALRVLETRQPTDIDTDNDRYWKVVGRKSKTPLRKAGDGGQSKTNSLYQSLTRGGAVGRNDGHDKAADTVRDKGQDKAAGTVRDKGQDKTVGTIRDKGKDKAAGTVLNTLYYNSVKITTSSCYSVAIAPSSSSSSSLSLSSSKLSLSLSSS